MRLLNKLNLLFGVALYCCASAGAVDIVNANGESVAILQEAAKTLPTENVVIWETSLRGRLTKEKTEEIAAFVARGGGLLLMMGPNTGSEMLRLAAVSPTTGWHGLVTREDGGPLQLNGPAAIKDCEGAFFGNLNLTGQTVGYHFSIRPFHQVERGIQRYERYPATFRYLAKNYLFGNSAKDCALPAEHTFWTRPLLNRDWQGRLLLDNIEQTALLMTGRYGAGRVAVVACAADQTASWPIRKAFWTTVLGWLAKKSEFIVQEPPAIAVQHEVEVAKAAGSSGLHATVLADREAHTFGVRLENETSADVKAELVCRLANWQWAMLDNFEARVIVPAHGSKIARWQLPKPGPTHDEALGELDAYVLRFGVLDETSRKMLVGEQRCFLDLTESLQLKLVADNLYTINPHPFPGTAMQGKQGSCLEMSERMGWPTHAYAYKPESKVRCAVELKNGLANLAPLARVIDELAPKNPTAVAINDLGGSYRRVPAIGDGVEGYSFWNGKADADNSLRFDFPEPVNICAVELIGNAPQEGNLANAIEENPGALRVEADGKAVFQRAGLGPLFASGHGRVRFEFPSVRCNSLRIVFPWVKQCRAPRLGEIAVEGFRDGVTAMDLVGQIMWQVKDALSGMVTARGQTPVTLPARKSAVAMFEFVTPALANQNDLQALRVEAVFTGKTQQIPILVINPANALKPRNPDQISFYSSYGVRHAFSLGTGTKEHLRGSVAQADDQVWIFSRGIKQVGRGGNPAQRMYVSSDGLATDPCGWIEFHNGDAFWETSLTNLVRMGIEHADQHGTKTVVFMLSDWWQEAPEMHTIYAWQHLLAFDKFLRTSGKPGLKGKTHREVGDEIHEHYEREWVNWNLRLYVERLTMLGDAFRQRGYEFEVRAQGFPIVPPEFAKQIAAIIRRCNDDCTWVMVGDNEAWTTGRQLVQKAFNPYFQWQTMLVWGWVSSMLGSPVWQNPPGTCETTRRKQFNRAWLGALDFEGRFVPFNDYGFNLNGGHAFCMTPVEWQQWWQLAEQHALIQPDHPLGAGLVLSTDPFGVEKHPLAGRGQFATRELPVLRGGMRAWRALGENGVAMAFGANARSLANYTLDQPLVLVGICDFSPAEIQALSKLQRRGVALVAFKGDGPLSPEAAAFFSTPGADRLLYYPLGYDEINTWTVGRALAKLHDVLRQPIQWPAGVTGYAFWRGRQLFVVLEDREERGRVMPLRVKAANATPAIRACALNDHATLATTWADGWWTIATPTRPGDGTLVCIEGFQP